MRQRARSIIPMVRNLGLFFVAILAVVVTIIVGQFPTTDNPLIPVLGSKFYYEKSRDLVTNLVGSLGDETLRNILKTEMPVLNLAEKSDREFVRENSPFFRVGLNLLAGVRLEDPLTYLKAEIPMLGVVPVTADNFDETAIDQVTEPPGTSSSEEDGTNPPRVSNTVTSDVPLVAVYATHTSETYELTDGLTHLKGKSGGVAKAADEIKKVIEEQYGIGVTFESTIHDLSYNQSYVESEKTVQRLIKENPGLQLVFDIHRDGNIPREQSVTKIDGQDVAKILLVVGTDARAEHPNWEENLKLARLLAAKLDSLYPGLSRGISIKDGRYNQQYSTGALLVEIGSTQNTIEEAVASSRLLANAVVALLNDMHENGEQVLDKEN